MKKGLPLLHGDVKKRIWIFSDLQQAVPAHAKRCLQTAVDDFQSLDLPCDYIWYLGDATESGNLAHVKEMRDIQLALLTPLQIPLRYLLGNHEFDLLRAGETEEPFPFYEAVKRQPGWKTIERIDRFSFMEEVGDYTVVFFSDHAAEDGSWHTTNGSVRGDADAYPYRKEDYADAVRTAASAGRPIITASHYAFSGGARPSDLLDQALPLPDSVKIHFHGHAHIGDAKWAGKDCHRKIAWVDRHDIPQINVSSLESGRGSSIRSVFLEMYEGGGLGVFFRDHERKRWTESFFRSAE